MALELKLPVELEQQAVAYAARQRITLSSLIVALLSDFFKKQQWHNLKKWLEDEAEEWPAQWEEGDDLDTLLAGVNEGNLHGEIDFGPPVGAEVW
jgi:hypothetical protein